ncbi:MAG: CDP-alcohol phosphatidyltransferase family protein, partial [Actinomyces sp.]|nr:CDP-alcohol phosphatidyltransferase family protein [Actinomyces sp.]
MAHIIGGIVLGNHGRSITKAIFTPVARVLVAAHITPNMVTIAGTVVTIAVAVTTFPFGYLWQGALALAVVLFCDSIDGVLARMSGTSSPFGAFLDSTMDRLGDGAVFGSLTAFAIFSMESSPSRTVSIVAGLITIVGAATVSYSRARAESIGVIAKVGIAERTDR